MTTTGKGFWALFMTGVLYASTCVFVREVAPEFSAYHQVLYRDLGGLCAALCIALILRRPLPCKQVRLWPLLGLAGAYGLAFVCFTFAILHTTFIVALVGLYASSILVSVALGVLILRESLTATDLVGLGLVFAGLWLFSDPFSSEFSLDLGFGYGCLGGSCLATSNLLRKQLGGSIAASYLIAVHTLGGVVISASLVGLSGQALIPSASLKVWGVMTGYAAVSALIAYLLVFGFRHFDLNLGSVLLSSELVFATVLGLLLYHEIPSLFQLIGSLVILLAIVVLNVPWPCLDSMPNIRS